MVWLRGGDLGWVGRGLGMKSLRVVGEESGLVEVWDQRLWVSGGDGCLGMVGVGDSGLG